MEVFYTRCCGLDVHKSSITACVRLHDGGGKPRKIVRRFGAMTNDLRAMASWLIEEGVTHVAMESTGVYWKPVWNILEGQFTLVLANAQHVKNVPEEGVSNYFEQKVNKRKWADHNQHIKGMSYQPNHKCDYQSYGSVENSHRHTEAG